MIIIPLLLIILLSASGQITFNKAQEIKNSILKFYIPKDIENYFIQIDKILPDRIKKIINEKKKTSSHQKCIGVWVFG